VGVAVHCRGMTRRQGEIELGVPGPLEVKAFNTMAAPVVARAAAVPGRLSLLYCGDQAGAKRVAAGLIVDAGFVPVDAGRLDAARDVEALGRLLVDLAYGRGTRAGRLPVAHPGGAVDGRWVRAAGRHESLAAVVFAEQVAVGGAGQRATQLWPRRSRSRHGALQAGRLSACSGRSGLWPPSRTPW
jgi:hypothetical protein